MFDTPFLQRVLSSRLTLDQFVRTLELEKQKEEIIEQMFQKHKAVVEKREVKREKLKEEARKRIFDIGRLLDQRQKLMRQVYSCNDLLSRPEILGLDKHQVQQCGRDLTKHSSALAAIDQAIKQLHIAVNYAQGEVFLLGAMGGLTQVR